MVLNIAKKEGEMAFTQLNETSDKVMMDALIVFKADDYCPVFDDDFEPDKRTPFAGEVSFRSAGYNEVGICEDFFPDELSEKLYGMGYGREGGEEPNWLAEKTAAMEVLDDMGYEFKPVFGMPTGKVLDNGVPEIHYSLDQSKGAKVYGFTLTERSASDDYAKLFVAKENGADISLHAVKVYQKDEIPEKPLFAHADNEEIRDEQIFGFLDNKGIFVPESELNHEFEVASMLDLKAQIEKGKDFAHLPESVKNSPSLCMIVVANNPSDLSKVPTMNGPDHRKSTFIDGVVSKMGKRSSRENIKEDSLKLLQETEKILPDLVATTAGKLIRSNCMDFKDLPTNLTQDPLVAAEVVKNNVHLLNKGEFNGIKLEDIPKDILTTTKVVNIIADQFKAPFGKTEVVEFKNLPKELQEHPVILGREAAQNVPLLSFIPQELKHNPEFLNSFFKPLKKEQFPEMFDKIYGGIHLAPAVAKLAAISDIKLQEPDVRPVLEATFGKQKLNEMIIDAQKAEFGKEKDFSPNLTGDGYKHLLSANVTINALGEIETLKFNFDNSYVTPDGDHNGWQSIRSKSINPSDYNEGRIVGIQVPMIGHEQAKKDVSMAMGGKNAPTMWIPIVEKGANIEKQKSVNRHMSIDDNGKSMGG